MNNLLLVIILTTTITSVLWIAYLKLIYDKNRNIEKENILREKEDLIKDTNHNIEIIKKENLSELNLLKEEVNNLKKSEEIIKDTLKIEREASKTQLATLKNVESWKTTITQNMGEYSSMINKQQEFIDKLTGNAKYQGDFGEKFLEQSLTFHGFKNGVDYTKQKQEEIHDVENDQIQYRKPDIILNIGNDNHIICDSKVSLDNWTKFVNAKDDQERNEQFKKHATAIKNHIDTLSKKNYMKSLKKAVFNKVIMYMPHEAAYLAALEQDNDLYEYAYKKNVLLVGPMNLFPIISIVQTIQGKEKQIQGIKEITDTATHLMDKYAQLKGYIIKTMTTFNQHRDSLSNVINSAYKGKGSLEKRIEKLRDQGINPSKTIPENIELKDNIEKFEDEVTSDSKDLN